MRKHKEKKLKKETIMVIFVALIMISSIIGYIWGEEGTQKFKYKDISFTRKENQWSAIINDKEAVFNYFPTEVEDIIISPDITARFSNKVEIDTTYDFNNSYKEEIAFALYELRKALDKHLNIYLRSGFTTNTSYALPIITCANATSIVPVVYFKQSNETSIHSENNCVVIEAGRGVDFIRIKDRLLYSLFNII